MFKPMAAPPAAPEGNALLAALDRIAPKSGPSFGAAMYVAPPTIRGAARASMGLRTDMFLSCTASTGLRRTAPCAAGEAKQWPPMLCSQTKRARLGLQGSPVPRRNASQACTASASRAPRSDQWRRASRRVFCWLGDLLEVSSSHCQLCRELRCVPRRRARAVGLWDLGAGRRGLSFDFTCGLARIIAARGTPSPRPLTAVRLLGCPRDAPTSHGPRGGSTQEGPPRTPTY